MLFFFIIHRGETAYKSLYALIDCQVTKLNRTKIDMDYENRYGLLAAKKNDR
jgi:hypothetical protein